MSCRATAYQSEIWAVDSQEIIKIVASKYQIFRLKNHVQWTPYAYAAVI